MPAGSSAATVWFKDTFGFEESSYDETRQQFTVEEEHHPIFKVGFVLTSRPNQRRFYVGPFDCHTVERLERNALGPQPVAAPGRLRFQNVRDCVRRLHQDPRNAGAVFQVASQFNCLEMVGPSVTPEHGVACYAVDLTQGPACALCCPAATVFRNYFVNGTGQRGRQLNLLGEVERLLDNDRQKYWAMTNGYCLPTDPGSIGRLNERLREAPDLAREALQQLQVGVHWDTQVGQHNHRVCQVFCSALPISYAKATSLRDWEPLATLVLQGAYVAVLATAVVLARKYDRRISVYLTALGGGAFGNPHDWIASAIEGALQRYRAYPLDVHLVHYNSIPRGPYQRLDLLYP